MQKIFNNSSVENTLPNHWINWCRLCAKEDEQCNINFLYQNGEHLNNDKKLSIQEALEKYFCVQASLEDYLPKMLCTNCLSLVTSMINFNERVGRVQLMFAHLAANNLVDANSIRLKYDATESERDLWFDKCPLSKVDKRSNQLGVNENGQQYINGDKFQIQIKQENLEKLMAMNYDKYTEEDSILEKDEVVNDSFPENEEDPFQQNETDEHSFSEEDELVKQQLSSNNCQLDRSKQKMKRKKLKQFSNVDCKISKNVINDFTIEATCKDCGTFFSKYRSYREHMQQQHEHIRSEKYWPCPACDKVLLSFYNIERHIRIHVPLEVRQTIKCPECDNRYTSNAQLDTHIRYKHKNEKPFICEECGLCLRTNSNLRQHRLIHTDIAPYECEVCKKKFKNKTRLKTHMDIHSPNKHVCNICGLQLNSRATLNRHFLVHSDEMQHKCDYCGKAFKRAKALKNHLLLHTGLKPYSCDFCERTFANGSNCRSHMKKNHPEELAILEASGIKTHTKNIPKLETLKAVTKAADNLTPVVTKFSGCFAFGKKPKHLETNDTKQKHKSQPSPGEVVPTQVLNEKLAAASPSPTPLDLQYLPLVGNDLNNPCPLANVKNQENNVSTSSLETITPIPNFDNIYQHILKQNHQTDLQIKRPHSQISPQPPPLISTVQPNPFYHDIIHQSRKPLSQQPTDVMLPSPESHHSSMTPLTHDDHSSASSIQGTFYDTIRTSLTPGNFM